MGAVAFVAVAVGLGGSLWDLLQRRSPRRRDRAPAAEPAGDHDVMELL
jgi:hypothetical protein